MAWQGGKSYIARNRNNPILQGVAFWCQRYLRAFDNEFNWDMESNGEQFILETVVESAPGIVFDVGANVGSYTSICSRLTPVSEVHAFEISPHTFTELERNCVGLRNVHLNPFGLSDKAGFVEIYQPRESSARTSLYAVKHGLQNEVLHAEVRTGDSYIEASSIQSISFLKVDVEGADLSALHGFRRAFREQRILAVQFEHGEPSVESRTFLRDLVRYLGEFGMTSYVLFPQHLQPVDDTGYRMENFRGRNYVALSHGLAEKLRQHVRR